MLPVLSFAGLLASLYMYKAKGFLFSIFLISFLAVNRSYSQQKSLAPLGARLLYSPQKASH
ncbi:hypothetical protein CLOLEP_01438 [[Clostridium] leptum DSM 753]|uniref:Uncharacterized protein n=1 Tax=[Clostridium] leptum DSM 753 TaxID=428125 RepID=A7VSA0_9FIRM|nr:hypothetical protein CLOLEP_01438 [[Clostridium] leptum DSM 753]